MADDDDFGDLYGNTGPTSIAVEEDANKHVNALEVDAEEEDLYGGSVSAENEDYPANIDTSLYSLSVHLTDTFCAALVLIIILIIAYSCSIARRWMKGKRRLITMTTTTTTTSGLFLTTRREQHFRQERTSIQKISL